MYSCPFCNTKDLKTYLQFKPVDENDIHFVDVLKNTTTPKMHYASVSDRHEIEQEMMQHVVMDEFIPTDSANVDILNLEELMLREAIRRSVVSSTRTSTSSMGTEVSGTSRTA